MEPTVNKYSASISEPKYPVHVDENTEQISIFSLTDAKNLVQKSSL